MKKSIDILLQKLEEKNITRHVVCPSAAPVIEKVHCCIKNAIEIIDERSAGYVATGMSGEIGEPIVVWCLENETYRNLMSALTEAYYRKLPILVVALSEGNGINQTINPHDTIRYYANASMVASKGTEMDIDVAINYLFSDVKGPVYLSIGTYLERIDLSQKEAAINCTDITAITNIIPSNACLHLGSNMITRCDHIKDTILRSGRCAKDGNLSMLIGSSVIEREQLHVGIYEEDEIYYDMNMLGNRHVGNNLVIFSVVKKGKNSAINDFASRMSWDCRHINISEIDSVKVCLTVNEKPQYIEIEL